MLSILRRFTNSKAGVVVTFVVLGIIALAFAAGDITGLSGAGGVLGNGLASAGGTSISANDVRRRAQDQVRAAQQRSPGLDMPQFVALGGVDAVIGDMLNGVGLEKFGHDQGIRVSRAIVGSEIRSIPAFASATGQFDQATYERLIAQRGLTDAQVQSEIARERMVQFLVIPTIGAHQVPTGVATPFAALLLEQRIGAIGLIPAAAVPAGPAPTDAEAQTWYKAHQARYVVPERRIVRYAVVTPDSVAAQAVPTDADVQKAYDGDRAKYAPRETRTVALVTVLDQKAADALAAKAKGGASLADAARAAGLEARTIADADKATLSSQTSAAVADAAFGAAKGATIGPVRGAIGFVVARIDDVKQVPGRSLAQARDEIVATLTKTKTTDALTTIQNAIDDALADNASLNEVAKDQKLAIQATPPLLASGVDPETPATKPDPRLATIMQAGYAAEEGDTPTIVPIGQDGSFAVVAVDRVVHAAPRPLAQVRDAVAKDIVADRRKAAAKKAADAVLAKVKAGTPLAAALSQSGVPAPAPRPIDTTRAAVNANQKGPDPALAMLFSMKQGAAGQLEAPGGQGWLIVKLDRVVPGDVKSRPGVVDATRGDIGNVIGQEYAQEFARAALATVGVKRNEKAIADLKRELSGQGGSNQQ